jgi:hypothetical protein
MEKLVEWTVLAGETEIFGENLLRRHFVHHKSHLPDPGANPSRRGGKPATNRFGYFAAVCFNNPINFIIKGDNILPPNVNICQCGEE